MHRPAGPLLETVGQAQPTSAYECSRPARLAAEDSPNVTACSSMHMLKACKTDCLDQQDNTADVIFSMSAVCRVSFLGQPEIHGSYQTTYIQGLPEVPPETSYVHRLLAG